MGIKNGKLLAQIGKRFEKVRLDLGLSPKDMAQTLDIQSSGYQKNEKGQTTPSLRTLGNMLKRHDISMNWLLFNKGPVKMEEKPEPPPVEKEEPIVLDADTRELIEAMERDRGLRYDILGYFFRRQQNPGAEPGEPR